PHLVAGVEGRLERVALLEQAVRLRREGVHRVDLAEGPAEVREAARADPAARHARDLSLLLLPARRRLEARSRLPRGPAGARVPEPHVIGLAGEGRVAAFGGPPNRPRAWPASSPPDSPYRS